MNGIHRVCVAVALCVVFSVANRGDVLAEAIDYGDFQGTAVMYRSVIENSVTNTGGSDGDSDGLGIYGEPTISGDVLNFNVPSFFALAEEGNQTDVSDGLITFGLEPLSGYGMALSRLAIREFGSVNFFTFFGGTAAADVAAPMFLSVTEVLVNDGTDDGLNIVLDQPVVLESSLEILSDANVGPGWNSNDHPDTIGWVAEAEVDLVQTLLDELPALDDEFDLIGVSRFQFSMNNTLAAGVDNDLATSFIDKKHLEFRPTIAVVPEPSYAGIFVVAIALLRRRMFTS